MNCRYCDRPAVTEPLCPEHLTQETDYPDMNVHVSEPKNGIAGDQAIGRLRSYTNPCTCCNRRETFFALLLATGDELPLCGACRGLLLATETVP